METSNIGLIYNPIIATEARIKYVLYARKSTESDEQQALSIDYIMYMLLVLARIGEPLRWLSELSREREWIELGIKELSLIFQY